MVCGKASVSIQIGSTGYRSTASLQCRSDLKLAKSPLALCKGLETSRVALCGNAESGPCPWDRVFSLVSSLAHFVKGKPQIYSLKVLSAADALLVLVLT
jgi:hypothetical protein